jgi:hypothetical protein
MRDSEVITMLLVGEFLGHDTDEGIHTYFRRHWRAWFPHLGDRTTFLRQAANLWAVLAWMQNALAWLLGAFDDPHHIVDGAPVTVCVMTRRSRARTFRGEAATSYCASKRLFYHGFKLHLVVTLEGVVTAFSVTAANVDERQAAWDVVENLRGLLLGDKGYVSAFFRSLLAEQRLRLETPVRARMKDGLPFEVRRLLNNCRRRIETVIGQLTERFHIHEVWAEDRWHLTARMNRKVLAHTVACALNRAMGREVLDFDGLLVAA